MGKDFVPLFVMWELAAKLPNAMIVKKKENKQ